MPDYMEDLLTDWEKDFTSFFDQYGVPAIWRSNRKNFDSETGNPIYDYSDKPIRVLYNTIKYSGFQQKKEARYPDDIIKISALEDIQNDDILFINGDEWIVLNSTNVLRYNHPDKIMYVNAELKKKIQSSGNYY